MRYTALIDGDVVAYRAAYLAEKEHGDWMDACDLACRIASHWAKWAGCEEVVVCRSETSFRYGLWPDYKANRASKPKPELLPACWDGLSEEFTTACKPSLEADDVMGLLQTDDTVIVTIDKDLLQVPGRHFNPDKMKPGETREVSPEAGRRWFLRQWLTGDPTDHYPGLPGIGPKRADKILNNQESFAGTVERILSEFLTRGHSLEFATVQARLAYILHKPEDYCESAGAARWSPWNDYVTL